MLLRARWMLFAPLIALLAQDSSVIRVNTRMVEVNVIVRDGKGPVAGLTRGDFTLFDKGKPQKIAFFSANTIRHAAAAPAPQPGPRAVFTNRPGTGADAPQSVTVVLLDGLNTQFQDQIYAKKQVVKFLGQIRPDDHVAVYALGNGLRVLHDFSSDSRSLLNAVAKFNGENLPFVDISEPDPSNTSDADLDTHLNDLFQSMADQSVMNRVRLTSAALISIANHVSHLPGRKTLVWVSSSFPFSLGACGGENPTDWNQTFSGDGSKSGCMQFGPPPVTASLSAGKHGASAGGAGGPLNASGPSQFMMPSRENIVFDVEIRKAVQALNAANVVIDPVDARGLTSMPKMFLATMPSRPKGSAPPPFQDTSPTGITVMEIVAADTGGRAFYNTNDIEGAIRRAIDDSAVTYTLGFYPDSKLLDAKFHPLKVEVARKGVELRYRKGYTASQDSLLTDDDREQVLKDALWSPLAATGITIAATLSKIDKTERITLIIDPAELEFSLIDSKRKAEIAIAFEQRSIDGHDLGKTEQIAPITLDEDRYQSKQPLTLTKTLTPAEGLSEVRVAVFDRRSGRIGSLAIPIK